MIRHSPGFLPFTSIMIVQSGSIHSSVSINAHQGALHGHFISTNRWPCQGLAYSVSRRRTSQEAFACLCTATVADRNPRHFHIVGSSVHNGCPDHCPFSARSCSQVQALKFIDSPAGGPMMIWNMPSGNPPSIIDNFSHISSLGESCPPIFWDTS